MNQIQGIIHGWKAAVDSLLKEETEFSAGGLPIKCTHCGNGQFQKKDIQLNTLGVEMMSSGWLNASAHTLTCHGCGKIEWFAKVDSVNSASQS